MVVPFVQRLQAFVLIFHGNEHSAERHTPQTVPLPAIERPTEPVTGRIDFTYQSVL